MGQEIPTVSYRLEWQLRQFLTTNSCHAIWVEDDVMKVYVRKSYRRVLAEHVWVLDISNVQVVPEYQGKGYFKVLVQKIEQILAEQHPPTIFSPTLVGIYVENVQQERFRKGLVRMGFEGVAMSGWREGVVDCFFTPLPMKFGST